MNSPDRYASIDIAVQTEHADCAAIPAACIVLQILNSLSGRFFRRSDDRDRPHMREESVERVKAIHERAFHVVNRVEKTGIRFDQPSPDHAYRSGNTDPRLVISIHVTTHRQL